ncbi:CDP-glycerol glycerophosphotransferase family protein [Nesterenkonia populi]
MVLGARAVYALLKLLPTRRKVVLMTRDLRQIRVDFALLKDSIRRNHPDYEIKVIRHRKLSAGYLLAALREMYHLATCRAILVDGYIIPVSVLNHRKGLPVGQIWHALGGFKNFAYLVAGTPEGPDPAVAKVMRMHANYTFMCAAGTVPAEVFAKAFQIEPDSIRPLGMARVDYLLDETGNAKRRERILKRYPQLAEGRTVLYTPTSRLNRSLPYQQLADQFRHTDANLVIIPHPVDKTPLPDDGETLIGSEFGIMDWLSVADVIISDYSAVVYEAALRDIPTIFWAYDLEEFGQTRGFPLDYEAESPGPIVSTAEEAVSTALSLGSLDYTAWRARHLDYVTGPSGELPTEPGRCSDRIVEALKLS